MTEEARQVFWQIVECGLSSADPGSPCHAMFKSQHVQDAARMQIPEPWIGDIENARLLFIGINPHLDHDEKYPRLSDAIWREGNDWHREMVEGFFLNRFDPGQGYTRRNAEGQFYARLRNEGWSRVVKYWGFLYQQAKIALNRSHVVPGVDYALMEGVCCKSGNQADIPDYRCCCQYWQPILRLARNVERVVIVGGLPRALMASIFNIGVNNPHRGVWMSGKIEGRHIRIIFIDHPKNLEFCVVPDVP